MAPASTPRGGGDGNALPSAPPTPWEGIDANFLPSKPP